MKLCRLILLTALFPAVCFSSNSKDCSNSIPYIGISSTAACITGYSALRFIMPNKQARQTAPCIYLAGKTLLACGAVTSGVSSAFAFKGVAQAIDSQIDEQYLDIAGAILPLGYLLSTIGDLMVNRASMQAHDKQIRSEAQASTRAALLPPSWVDNDAA